MVQIVGCVGDGGLQANDETHDVLEAWSSSCSASLLQGYTYCGCDLGLRCKRLRHEGLEQLAHLLRLCFAVSTLPVKGSRTLGASGQEHISTTSCVR